MRCPMVLVLALALLAPAGAQESKKGPTKEPTPKPQASEKEQPAGGGEGATPVFRGKGEEMFKKGQELFEAEKYKDALAEMKRAKDQGKTPADKELVQTWVSACEGGIALENYKKEAQHGAASRVYFFTMEALDRYRSTPIAPKLNAFADELALKTLVVLENFDSPSPRYSEKFGKRFINDPKLVFRGSHSLEWTTQKDGKASQLRLKDPPAKWTPFQSIVFWVHWERPVNIQLLAMTGGKSEGESNALEYTVSPGKSGRAGWEVVKVDLERFKAHGSANWNNVQDFMLQIEAKSTFKFDIDEIALVRKDKPDAGSADSDTKDDKKQKKQQKKTGGAGPAKQTERKKS